MGQDAGRSGQTGGDENGGGGEFFKGGYKIDDFI